jgi:tetratricopeptide (TPR) repeat protein
LPLVIPLKFSRLSIGSFITALLLLATLTAGASADGLTPDELYQQTTRSTAMIVVPQGEKASQGTGWLVDRDRKLLITNRHVVGTQKNVQILFPVYRNGQLIDDRTYYLKEAPRYRGQVIEANSGHDLAIIQLDHLPKEARPLKLAAERPLSRDSILLIGNPGGSPTMWVQTLGTIQSAPSDRVKIKFSDQDLDARVDMLEVKSPVRPGASGGPIVNKDGDLVAVTSGVDKGTHVLSIDVSEVREMVSELYHREGLRHHNLGSFQLAVADYSAAISLNHSDARAYHYRGISNKRMENYRQAIDDCTKAIQLDSRNSRAYNERGAAHSFLEEYDDAIWDYTMAIKLDPVFVQAYRNRGSSHAHKGEWQDAIADYTTAIQLDHHDSKSFLKRSQAYAKLGDRAKSQEDLEEALQLDPTLKR